VAIHVSGGKQNRSAATGVYLLGFLSDDDGPAAPGMDLPAI
jgi:hypothetical protein